MASIANLGSAAGIGGITEAPSWRTRLREAAYTPPGGTRLTFSYEDVSREVDRLTSPFEFPGVDNSYVQQNGTSSRRYPLKCLFYGRNCDLQANAFEKALLQKGIGKLEHPVYGAIDVVPFGTITRRDEILTAANRSIVEVTFWTSLADVYPSGEVDPQNEILSAVDTWSVAAASQFANSAALKSALNKANALSTMRKFLKNVSKSLDKASSAVSSVNAKFRDAQSALNYGIDVLIGQPLLLAQQTINLVRAPARALMGIESRLAGYRDLADSIMGSAQAAPAELLAAGTALALRTDKIANDVQISDLFVMSALAGSITAAIADPVDDAGDTSSVLARSAGVTSGANFTTRPQAIEAAAALVEQLEASQAWRDDCFAALGGISTLSPAQVDTGESYQAIKRATSLAAGYLVQLSFTLRPERRIVLDRARTIVDLAAEIYGSVDDKLDLLIQTNALTGSEILELPPGRVIRYYPEA